MARREYESPRYEEREARVTEALQTLEQGIDAILTTDGFTRYLRLMSRLTQYSAGNLALIYAQRPDATRVAGYRTWQALGRQVRKGEKGITILVPHKHRIAAETEGEEDRVIVRGFGTGTVFDVSATDGPALPEPPDVELLGGASDPGMRLYVDLLDYLELQRVSTDREQTAPSNGYFDPLRRHVAVGVHIDGDQATKTLMHETAHLVAGHTLAMDSRDVETVAESSAFVALAHFGIESRGYSFPYVATWAQERSVLKRNLDAIQQVAHTIVSALTGHPEPMNTGQTPQGERTLWQRSTPDR
jgi:hypothetical protein